MWYHSNWVTITSMLPVIVCDKVCSTKMMMNTDNVESSLLTSIY